jgi:hypothetical protein
MAPIVLIVAYEAACVWVVRAKGRGRFGLLSCCLAGFIAMRLAMAFFAEPINDGWKAGFAAALPTILWSGIPAMCAAVVTDAAGDRVRSFATLFGLGLATYMAVTLGPLLLFVAASST